MMTDSEAKNWVAMLVFLLVVGGFCGGPLGAFIGLCTWFILLGVCP